MLHYYTLITFIIYIIQRQAETQTDRHVVLVAATETVASPPPLFFKVSSKAARPVTHIVLIFDNGNIGSTDPFHMNNGMPGEVVLAAFQLGRFAINLTRHFHPDHVRNHCHFLSSNAIQSLSIHTDRDYVMSDHQ